MRRIDIISENIKEELKQIYEDYKEEINKIQKEIAEKHEVQEELEDLMKEYDCPEDYLAAVDIYFPEYYDEFQKRVRKTILDYEMRNNVEITHEYELIRISKISEGTEIIYDGEEFRKEEITPIDERII